RAGNRKSVEDLYKESLIPPHLRCRTRGSQSFNHRRRKKEGGKKRKFKSPKLIDRFSAIPDKTSSGAGGCFVFPKKLKANSKIYL
ncbi:hypothetical protein V4Y02_23810, partial [Escherichia coli]